MSPTAADGSLHVDVSVVTYDSARGLAKLIASLADQTVDTRQLHLVFIDNASTDATVELLSKLERQHGAAFGSFEVLRNPRNEGFAKAHNRALAHAAAPYVFVLNPDTELYPDCLERLLRAATNDCDRVAAWEARQLPYEHPKKYDPVTMVPPWCSAAALLIRREAFAEAGGFDDRFFLYCEDVDFCWRLLSKGWELRYVPSACVRHDTYESSGQVKPLQFVQTVLGTLRLRTRYGTIGDVLRGFAVYFRTLLGESQFRGQRSAILKAGLRYLWDLPHFCRSRVGEARVFFSELDFAPGRLGAFHDSTPNDDSGNQPLVSILVRSIGRKAQVQRALATIANQTYANIEVVLVEDGAATLEGIVDAFANLRINYLPLGSRHGRCRAGNIAMDAATGKYLGFLDEDDELFADHVEQLVNCLDGSGARVAYGTAFEIPTQWNDAHEVTREGPPEVVFDVPFTYIELSFRNIMPICTVLFERSLYDECGGFDPELDRQEDWNLWLRFAQRSGRFTQIEKTTSLYRVPMSEDARTTREQTMLDYYERAREKQRDLRLVLPAEELAADYRRLLEHHAETGAAWPLQPPPMESRARRWTRWPIRVLRKALQRTRPSRRK